MRATQIFFISFDGSDIFRNGLEWLSKRTVHYPFLIFWIKLSGISEHLLSRMPYFGKLVTNLGSNLMELDFWHFTLAWFDIAIFVSKSFLSWTMYILWHISWSYKLLRLDLFKIQVISLTAQRIFMNLYPCFSSREGPQTSTNS